MRDIRWHIIDTKRRIRAETPTLAAKYIGIGEERYRGGSTSTAPGEERSKEKPEALTSWLRLLYATLMKEVL
jgi:hypothetical protein